MDFVVRVELHNVPESKSREIYEELHKKMRAKGFSKTITGGNGKTYQLPDSTYTLSSSTLTESQVNDLVSQIASTTGYSSSSIVFGWTGTATWTGLALIQNISPTI